MFNDRFLVLAIAAATAAVLLTLRKIRDMKQWPPPPVGTYRINWELVGGLWMLVIAFFLEDHRASITIMVGKIVGIVGSLLMLWGAFKVNKDVMAPPPTTNSGKRVKISELKQAKKK